MISAIKAMISAIKAMISAIKAMISAIKAMISACASVIQKWTSLNKFGHFPDQIGFIVLKICLRKPSIVNDWDSGLVTGPRPRCHGTLKTFSGCCSISFILYHFSISEYQIGTLCS